MTKNFKNPTLNRIKTLLEELGWKPTKPVWQRAKGRTEGFKFPGRARWRVFLNEWETPQRRQTSKSPEIQSNEIDFDWKGGALTFYPPRPSHPDEPMCVSWENDEGMTATSDVSDGDTETAIRAVSDPSLASALAGCRWATKLLEELLK